MAKEALTVHQQVWLESYSLFYGGDNEKRKVEPYEIVEANASSAYAVPQDELMNYYSDPKKHAYLKRRILQRTHEVKGNGWGGHYTLWRKEEDFHRNVTYNRDIQAARKEAHALMDKLPLKTLQEIIQTHTKGREI